MAPLLLEDFHHRFVNQPATLPSSLCPHHRNLRPSSPGVQRHPPGNPALSWLAARPARAMPRARANPVGSASAVMRLHVQRPGLPLGQHSANRLEQLPGPGSNRFRPHQPSVRQPLPRKRQQRQTFAGRDRKISLQQQRPGRADLRARKRPRQLPPKLSLGIVRAQEQLHFQPVPARLLLRGPRCLIQIRLDIP